MESENGVAVEEEKHVIGMKIKENTNKEDENNCGNGENQTQNEISKPIEEAEGPNSASDKVEVEANIKSSGASKNSKRAKVPYVIYQNSLSSTKLFM